MHRGELVSRRTRRAFRELATDTVLREIVAMWTDEGFPPGPPNEEQGERRSLYQSYLDVVDWTDPAHVKRALRVFEETARGIAPQYTADAFARLAQDGYRIDENGTITGGPVTVIKPASLALLQDAVAIRDHLDRISRAVSDSDPAQVVGSAKELVESTAKVVLHELGKPVDESDDLPALVTQVQLALGLHPSAAVAGADGSDGVKRILGGAMNITTGLAELRNRGYGTGHGPAGPRVGLGPRHAQLAISGARLWCEFVLDTLADPQAPWRRSGTT